MWRDVQKGRQRLLRLYGKKPEGKQYIREYGTLTSRSRKTCLARYMIINWTLRSKRTLRTSRHAYLVRARRVDQSLHNGISRPGVQERRHRSTYLQRTFPRCIGHLVFKP